MKVLKAKVVGKNCDNNHSCLRSPYKIYDICNCPDCNHEEWDKTSKTNKVYIQVSSKDLKVGDSVYLVTIEKN